MRSRYEIERILHSDLKEAMKGHSEAHQQFKMVIDAIPSDIPAPDGALRIRVVGRERRAAAEVLHSALVRFNRFMSDGIIPEDLA